MKNNTEIYSKTKQARLPLFLSDFLEIRDPVLTFDHFMEEINLEKYLRKLQPHQRGRIRYNPIDMLKTVLFGFMTKGYISLRELEDSCKVNIRFMYLMDHETPTYRTFGYFINEVLADSIEDIFYEINQVLIDKDHIDLQHLYIDGSKFEANANKYTWVWRKATEKSRYRLYNKITALIEQINDTLVFASVKMQTNTEYIPEELREMADAYASYCKLDKSTFAYGRGHRKTVFQRQYEQLCTYAEKLDEYVEKLRICGQERNSYSKTDNSATFMRMKTDYMGNDQLLPAYNVQIGVADEYIAVLDVNQYRSDMDCFVPLMEKFYQHYGFYPKYPVADAGYGSYNNYLYCEQHGLEKYMKFPMYKKETTDKKYRNNPYRVENFKRDDEGNLICPNDKKMLFAYRGKVYGNKYGRQYEYYTCEDCKECPHASKCKRTDKNRTIRLNEELTSFHKEVLDNLESIHGALLRMNRSIQAEGTFGVLKQDRWYKRIVRKGINSVKMELYLIAIGHNLYKYHNKQQRQNSEIA